MKTPTNRAKFMDDLRNVVEDVFAVSTERSWMFKRNVSDIIGREAYIEYTEEDAPQLLSIHRYCKVKELRIEFLKDGDELEFYVDGKYRLTLGFSDYKTKTAYCAAVVVWIERLLH